MIVVAIAFYHAITTFLRVFLTSLSGGRLTRHLRKQVFYFIVEQRIPWFDDDSHSLGLDADFDLESTVTIFRNLEGNCWIQLRAGPEYARRL
jgi:hypothetical protein